MAENLNGTPAAAYQLWKDTERGKLILSKFKNAHGVKWGCSVTSMCFILQKQVQFCPSEL